jgi:uncharacterized protein
MLRRLAIAAALFLAILPARAQDQAPYVAPKQTYEIFVFGDSLAGGLMSGMTRAAAGDPTLSVNGRFKEDSGLARPEFYDWKEAVPRIAQSNTVDIALIMIGSNDAQSIREGAIRHVFGTPEWAASYTAEIKKIVGHLKKEGAAVYWVELPGMSQAAYDESIKQISAIQAAEAKRLGIKYIEIRKSFAKADGSYTDSGPDIEGNVVRLRSRDGVHFLRTGNTRLGAMVLDLIRKDIAANGGAKAMRAAETAGESGPAFGQTGGAAAITVETAQNAASGPLGAAKADSTGGAVISQPTSLADLARLAGPGSSAEALFAKGRAPKPEPGRFDDFSYKP